MVKENYFVGLDVHKNSTAVCIVDSNGKIVKEKNISGHSKEVCDFLKQNVVGKFDVVFEACDGYGLWYEKLGKLANRVQVAHPNHLKVIWNTKRKTDRIDAKKLARLLFMDLIPGVHVPDISVRDWRMLITHRKKLVQKRTAFKNQVRAILRRNHIKAPKNLWSKKNMLWLANVDLPSHGEILQRDMLIDDLEHVNKQVARVEVELDARAARHPGVSLLKTIPQVGNRTAEAVVAWVDDVKRFSRSKQIGAYFGFAVYEDSSGGKRKQGHITCEGPGIIRHLLVETVWRMKRSNKSVQSWFEKYMHGDPRRKNIAAVAAAHKLSRCMFAMLQGGEHWREAA